MACDRDIFSLYIIFHRPVHSHRSKTWLLTQKEAGKLRVLKNKFCSEKLENYKEIHQKVAYR
jgi:hypothetical protein